MLPDLAGRSRVRRERVESADRPYEDARRHQVLRKAGRAGDGLLRLAIPALPQELPRQPRLRPRHRERQAPPGRRKRVAHKHERVQGEGDLRHTCGRQEPPRRAPDKRRRPPGAGSLGTQAKHRREDEDLSAALAGQAAPVVFSHCPHTLQPDAGALARDEARIGPRSVVVETVLHSNDQPPRLGSRLDRDETPGPQLQALRDSLAGLDRILQGVAEEGAQFVFVDTDSHRHVEVGRYRDAALLGHRDIAADDGVDHRVLAVGRGLRGGAVGEQPLDVGSDARVIAGLGHRGHRHQVMARIVQELTLRAQAPVHLLVVLLLQGQLPSGRGRRHSPPGTGRIPRRSAKTG